ncbi:MAG: ferredoxin reductase family protein [Candidatus Saccharimonadales bacterium]
MTVTQKRILKKTLAWLFWAANGGVITAVWAVNSGPLLFSEDLGSALISLGRLAGLLATFSVVTQFVLMGRVGWLEPIFGLDKIAIFHRRNGVAALALIIAHPLLIVNGYALLSGNDWVTQYLQTLQSPFVPFALLAEILFVTSVVTSIYIVRKHFKFETWYAVHLISYIAIVSVVWHQLANGAELQGSREFSAYWIGLYLFIAANMLIWRFGKPLYSFWRHRFMVEKVVKETDTATSVYITGKHMDRFPAKAGQFVMVRFFTKELGWQEHPFSLSMVPNSQHLRLTIRQLGDFTNQVPFIKPGTPVMVSGPYGAFTHEQQRQQKVLYIAGGVGITPIRAMIEERAKQSGGDAILLYGNRSVTDTIFLNELTQLGHKISMPVHNVVSEESEYSGEKGYVDKDKIARLVPDITERDIFLCGPPPMMAGVVAALKQLGVPAAQVHYERFSLHKG